MVNSATHVTFKFLVSGSFDHEGTAIHELTTTLSRLRLLARELTIAIEKLNPFTILNTKDNLAQVFFEQLRMRVGKPESPNFVVPKLFVHRALRATSTASLS